MIPRSPSSANTDVGRAVLDQPTEGERLLARIRSRVVPLQQIDRDSDIFSIFGGPRLRVLSSTARLFRELPYPEGDDIPRVKISPLIQAAETELSTLTPEKILNEIQSSAKDPTDFLKPFQCHPIGNMHKTIDFIGVFETRRRFKRHTPSHSLWDYQKALNFNGFHAFLVGWL